MGIVNLAYFVMAVAILVTIFNWILPDGSKALQKKFAQLGDMKGKTVQEIVSIAGNYKLREALPDGTAYTWSAPKYAIKIGFDNDGLCTKILSELNK